MTLAELCEAAMIVSDNTAGNLILASLGGPQAITDYARSLGDTVTRLDRIEPHLTRRCRAIRATPPRRRPCWATCRSWCSAKPCPPHRKSN